MTSKTHPDFSAIRSPLERAEAERGYEVGVEIADGILAIARFLRRVGKALAREANRPAREQRSLPTWE